MGKKSSKNLVWLDLEMTGLDVETEVIIEIATIVTDSRLNVLEEGPSIVINQDSEILDQMDNWNTKQHTTSGLLERVKESPVTLTEAENETLKFIKQYCPPKTSPLCGNSISHDRKFLAKYMKELHGYFHYRNIDVTSIKELVIRWYPNGIKIPKKSDTHLALIDVRESIEELKFYRKNFFIDCNQTPKARSTS